MLSTCSGALAASAPKNGSFEGYIKAITNSAVGEKEPSNPKLALEKYDGNTIELEVASDALLSIDQIPVQLKAFLPNMEVWGEVKNNRIISLQGTSASNPGYISPQTLIRSGMITQIAADQIMVKDADGKTTGYVLTPATVIMRNSRVISPGDLYTGDHARLYFDDIDATAVTRIVLEGPSVVVQNLLRGQLQQIDEIGKTIVLKEVKVLRNGTWEAYQPMLTLPFNADSPVYCAGQKVLLNNLKQYRGKSLYAAISNKLGRDRIEKMVINRQYETTWKEKIDRIKWYGEALELANQRNFTYNQGTIVIKNNRLMGAEALTSGLDTVLIADNMGTANVINVLDAGLNNNSSGGHHLYLARLDRVAEQELYVVNSAILEDNHFQQSSSGQTLTIIDETVFLDADNNKTLSLEDFKNDNYAIDESTQYARNHNLRDWYGYLYTDGDVVVSAVIKADLDEYDLLRVSTATVAQSGDGTFLELRDVKDWSARHQEWMQRSNNLKLVVNRASAIREDKVIDQEGLKVGDRLYIIRDDVYGKMLIVK